ncbi:GNAT family N-acetyltransferase [Erwinia persicina]|uniref:GNAT family N-acetyltransferase n=1 Tax=Erwinia persicina TaxID=55211 RepID=UPI0016547FA3|nr:GNAT family N-acetyltransferase [Erwinia persicina]MBC3947702.1 GNAT family N-acetyltransferase [Erwinia persicina]MCQ4095950.1 GNAT family N-acetyltransferase [Erwinia persicina]MCQ4102489.1 GNAT family N-acetyltransferase [Erwinia persicina]
MILRPMQADEFPAYRQIVIAEYGRDLAESRRCSLEDALSRATTLIDQALTQGVNSPPQRLLCITATEGAEPPVGYLWVSVSENIAWIYDIYLLPEWRGKGYGKQALDVINQQLALEGITETGLRVAANNSRAKKLYESLGFVLTGYNMSKRL